MNQKFGGLFNLDNPVFTVFGKLVDVLWLGLLWYHGSLFPQPS